MVLVTGNDDSANLLTFYKAAKYKAANEVESIGDVLNKLGFDVLRGDDTQRA